MRFGEFEIDSATGVLRRGGHRVRLQDLPFRLLVVLLNRAGGVVTREELRAELWGAETFVDAEAGLNTAIAKIREALGDTAESPRFIETLPKRGYRFIGTIDTEPQAPTEPKGHRRLWLGIALVLVLLAGFWGYSAYVQSGRPTIAVVRFHNETGNPAHDLLAGSLTDAVVVALAQNADYNVIGNSPLLRTDRIFAEVQRIGAALDADFVLLGQLQMGDTGLVVRAHFIRAADDRHLWAKPINVPDAAHREQQITAAVSEGVATGLKRHQTQ